MIKKYSRNSLFAELKTYDHLSGEHDWLEVTHWYNGEGFDVAINEKIFQMTWGQWDCLQQVIQQSEGQ